MKKRLLLPWRYVEVLYAKVLNLLRIERDASVIPEGVYCYVWDDERNEKEPRGIGRYWVKPCPYYRNVGDGVTACTFVGFIGYDPCLSDQCKICSENLGRESLDCFIGSNEN